MRDFVFNNLVQIIHLAFKQIARKTNQVLAKRFNYGTLSMSKQNQRSENLSAKFLNTFHLNNLFLLGVIACILSVLLVTSASAKELRINLTESLDMNSNDKKPKNLAKKAQLQEKIKSDKTKQIKPEKPKPKPIVKAKPTASTKAKSTVKAKPTTSTKTKHDTVKNSISNVR